MHVESCDEVFSSLAQGKKRSMYSAQRKSNEQYTILHSRLQYKKSKLCRACHAPVHRGEATCPWCGANRKMPVTGVTQRLPRLPAPVPWFRRYARLMIGLLITLSQAGMWLWLWPLPHVSAVTNRTVDPRFLVFYYAVIIALVATMCLHYRWTLRASIALVGLLVCWMIRVL